MLFEFIQRTIPTVLVVIAILFIRKTGMTDLHFSRSLLVEEVHRDERFAEFNLRIARPFPSISEARWPLQFPINSTQIERRHLLALDAEMIFTADPQIHFGGKRAAGLRSE